MDIAKACGASKQAVQGWIKTGRIDKKHLPKLAELTKLPLEWWLDSSQPIASPAPEHATHALARLQVIGRDLSESDWQTVIQVAQQLASKTKTPDPAGPPAGGVIATDKLQEMVEFQAKAEELHAQSEAKLKRRRAS